MITQNVLDYLEKSAEKYPEKKAVWQEDESVTYSELMSTAKSMGSFLKNIDVFRRPVGIYMEKGISAVSSFFGTLYAGGFYCLFNTDIPDSRLIKMQDVLQARIIITTDDLKEKATEIFGNCIIYSVEETIKPGIDEDYIQSVKRRVIDTDPVYINFTSGTTGVPKGIIVSHRSIVDFIENFTEIFDINHEDVIANQAPFDFDVSVKDIYSSIKTGATLVIVPKQYFSNPAKLLDYLCDKRATTLIWAVSALCLITSFHGLEYRIPSEINKIMFSGEVMPYKHLHQWLEHLPDALFVNLYGPTEITCNCTYHILEKGCDYSEGIPIGKSFPNENVFLLDDENKLIKDINIRGRIIVRGTALALGYWRLPEKNNECFIQNPLNPDYPEMVYVTGDLGKYDQNGDIVFCGRVDNQIKYMGHRIELEEVESAMMTIDGVDRCFCIFENDRLKGYYTGTIEKAELHRIMKERLPVFMIPGFMRKLDKIPLTKNGKIDRKQIVFCRS